MHSHSTTTCLLNSSRLWNNFTYKFGCDGIKKNEIHFISEIKSRSLLNNIILSYQLLNPHTKLIILGYLIFRSRQFLQLLLQVLRSLKD